MLGRLLMNLTFAGLFTLEMRVLPGLVAMNPLAVLLP